MIESKTKLTSRSFRELWIDAIDIEDTEQETAEAQLIRIAGEAKQPIVLIKYAQIPGGYVYIHRIGKKLYCSKRIGED